VYNSNKIHIDGGFFTAAPLDFGLSRREEIGEIFEDWE
jgi:hypothetical protein